MSKFAIHNHLPLFCEPMVIYLYPKLLFVHFHLHLLLPYVAKGTLRGWWIKNRTFLLICKSNSASFK